MKDNNCLIPSILKDKDDNIIFSCQESNSKILSCKETFIIDNSNDYDYNINQELIIIKRKPKLNIILEIESKQPIQNLTIDSEILYRPQTPFTVQGIEEFPLNNLFCYSNNIIEPFDCILFLEKDFTCLSDINFEYKENKILVTDRNVKFIQVFPFIQFYIQYIHQESKNNEYYYQIKLIF